jgi:hypothetical protein
MARGFVYLVAVMDWATRKVLSWRVSNTMDAGFCIDELAGCGKTPERLLFPEFSAADAG